VGTVGTLWGHLWGRVSRLIDQEYTKCPHVPTEDPLFLDRRLRTQLSPHKICVRIPLLVCGCLGGDSGDTWSIRLTYRENPVPTPSPRCPHCPQKTRVFGLKNAMKVTRVAV
jgi:hypothetical protein